MVQIGYVTNCLGKATIKEAVDIAERLEFDCLEVGPSIALDRATLRAIQRSSPVRIHSFIYGRNFLSPDSAQRESFRAELLRRLEIAVDVGVQQITTSTGVDPQLSLEENIDAALEFWASILDQARQGGVRIGLEFCPTAGNFALGPFAWRQLLDATRAWPNFGLNYDPSHLLWQFIEPYVPLQEFGHVVFSVHAKDTHIWRERLSEHGMLTPYARSERMAHGVEEARAIWWAYRLPGEGMIDWQKFFRKLFAQGFDDAINIEHEDHRYVGSREAVTQALEQSLRFLRSVTDAVKPIPRQS